MPIALRRAAVTTDPVKAAPSVPVAASTDLVVGLAEEVGLRTWTARLRTDRVAIFRASGSKTSNAAAVVEDLAAVIASVAVADSAAVIDLGVVALAEGAALVDSGAAAGAVDGNYLGLELIANFS